MTEATYNCKVVVSQGARVRPQPNTSNTATATLPYETVFQISEKVSDSLDPTNPAKVWGHIFGGAYDGKYTALEYPGNPSPISTSIPIVTIPPPVDPPGVVYEYPAILEVVPVMTDGTRLPMKEYVPKL